MIYIKSEKRPFGEIFRIHFGRRRKMLYSIERMDYGNKVIKFFYIDQDEIKSFRIKGVAYEKNLH